MSPWIVLLTSCWLAAANGFTLSDKHTESDSTKGDHYLLQLFEIQGKPDISNQIRETTDILENQESPAIHTQQMPEIPKKLNMPEIQVISEIKEMPELREAPQRTDKQEILNSIEILELPNCSINGVIYNVGDELPGSDPCSSCHCGYEGGPICSVAMCELPPCVDATDFDTVCCGRCPNGPNCYHGDQVLSLGEFVSTALGPSCNETCACPVDSHGYIQSQQAECHQICESPQIPEQQEIPETPTILELPELTTCTRGGVIYNVGDEIPDSDPCSWCYCSHGGEPMCAAAMCAVPPCVDATDFDTVCCGKCPNGHNCYHGDRILNAGEFVTTPVGPTCNETCACPAEPYRYNQPLHAVCHQICESPPFLDVKDESDMYSGL